MAGRNTTADPCLCCGKPLNAHGWLHDCPAFIADGALSYQDQLTMMAELNGWKRRAEAAEAQLTAMPEKRCALCGFVLDLRFAAEKPTLHLRGAQR